MPLVTSPASPWESYPFRQHSISAASPAVAVGGVTPAINGNSAQHSTVASHPKLHSQPSLRDLTMSPSARGSISGGSTMVNSRGSLSSLGSIGTMSSRTSMASVASMPSGDCSVGSGAEPTLTLWQHEEGPTSTLSGPKGTKGSVIGTASALGPQASLSISGLPRDLSARECSLIFTLASDFISADLNRNAVSGDVTISARFSSVHSAQLAGQAIERRSDLLGTDVKVGVQSFTSPFVSQSNTPRSLYPSRPLFAESYWSQQPPTPLSPSTATGQDLYSGSRRQSLISPTEAVYTSCSLGHINVGQSSPSHMDPLVRTNSNPSASSNASPGATAAGSSSASPGSSSLLLASQMNGTSQASASVIGTGLPLQSSTTAGASASTSHRPSLSSMGSTGTQGSSDSGSSHSSHATTQGSHGLMMEQNPHTVQSSHSHSQHHYHTEASQKIPPPNPADQNPPCNTLYVGNLPPDTSEAELKELFSQQPGYRRLCFRTKQNGPMCFVEFEDERLAGKALAELYGHVLTNSVKGGIRLSYSKNPLGVRSRPARR